MYDCDAVFLYETEMAVLVDIEGEEIWVPNSQIGDDSDIFVGCELSRGTEGRLVVKSWFARKEGLL